MKLLRFPHLQDFPFRRFFTFIFTKEPRMAAAVNKRTTESKYISLFADSRPDVDITFKDPLLVRPTSDYLVGVDNLTVCSTALSMIEPTVLTNHTDLIRIVRKPNYQGGAGTQRGLALYQNATQVLPAGDATFAANVATASITWADIRQDLTGANIPSTAQISSVGHLMERLQTVAAFVNAAMSSNSVAARTTDNDVGQAIANSFLAYASPQAERDAEPVKHLVFRLSRSGKLVIEGTKGFWSVCAIEVPTVRNQFGFYSSDKNKDGGFPAITGRRFLTVDPRDETASWGNMVVTRSEMTAGDPQVTVVNRVYHYDGTNTYLQQPAAAGSFYDGTAPSLKKIAVQLDANLFQGMDRRVAVELGTSLPIKNSPMITDQQEFPDFVIGRWMFRADNQYRVNDKGEESTYGTDAGATREYQSPQDRVTFHELMPQSKVQVLRMKLFARVRDFDEETEVYTVRNIILPTNSEDWWYARLHFVSKD